jgi:hypothetical protein
MPLPERDSDTLLLAEAASAPSRMVSGIRVGTGAEPQPER